MSTLSNRWHTRPSFGEDEALLSINPVSKNAHNSQVEPHGNQVNLDKISHTYLL